MKWVSGLDRPSRPRVGDKSLLPSDLFSSKISWPRLFFPRTQTWKYINKCLDCFDCMQFSNGLCSSQCPDTTLGKRQELNWTGGGWGEAARNKISSNKSRLDFRGLVFSGRWEDSSCFFSAGTGPELPESHEAGGRSLLLPQQLQRARHCGAYEGRLYRLRSESISFHCRLGKQLR